MQEVRDVIRSALAPDERLAKRKKIRPKLHIYKSRFYTNTKIFKKPIVSII